MQEIREDHSLREVIKLGTIPSSSAIGDCLRRMGERGAIEGMEEVKDGFMRKVLKNRGSKSLQVN